MKKKKISQKSRRHFREARDLYYRFRSVEDMLEAEIDEENRNAMEIIRTVFPWAVFYSIPAKELTIATLSIMGFLDGLEEAVKSPEPLDGLMKYCKEIFDGEHDNEYEESMQDFTDEEWGCYLAMVFAMLGNINSMKSYHRPISKLLIEAEKNDQSLLYAIGVDRSVIAHPMAAKKISIAQILGDESLMNKLAKALTRTIPRGKHELDDFRYMAEILDEKEGLSTYSYEELADLFINELDVYKENIHGDGAAAIKKLLQRRKKAIGT